MDNDEDLTEEVKRVTKKYRRKDYNCTMLIGNGIVSLQELS